MVAGSAATAGPSQDRVCKATSHAVSSTPEHVDAGDGVASSSSKGAGTKAERRAQRQTDAKALEDEEARKRFMSRADVLSRTRRPEKAS